MQQPTRLLHKCMKNIRPLRPPLSSSTRHLPGALTDCRFLCLRRFKSCISRAVGQVVGRAAAAVRARGSPVLVLPLSRCPADPRVPARALAHVHERCDATVAALEGKPLARHRPPLRCQSIGYHRQGGHLASSGRLRIACFIRQELLRLRASRAWPFNASRDPSDMS